MSEDITADEYRIRRGKEVYDQIVEGVQEIEKFISPVFPEDVETVLIISPEDSVRVEEYLAADETPDVWPANQNITRFIVSTRHPPKLFVRPIVR